MTARSRRRKADKRRKSDARPHPRLDQSNRGSEESVPVVRDGKLKSVSLVKEGDNWFPGAKIEFTPVQETYFEAGIQGSHWWNIIVDEGDGLVTLNEVDPKDYSIITGAPNDKLYLNDSEKEALDTVQREYDERHVEAKKPFVRPEHLIQRPLQNNEALLALKDSLELTKESKYEKRTKARGMAGRRTTGKFAQGRTVRNIEQSLERKSEAKHGKKENN